MPTTAILAKTPVGPLTATSANMALKGGLTGSYAINFDIDDADLKKSGTLVDATVEAINPDTGGWEVIATKHVEGPWTKKFPPGMSMSWSNSDAPAPDRTIRVSLSIPQRINMGVSVTKA